MPPGQSRASVRRSVARPPRVRTNTVAGSRSVLRCLDRSLVCLQMEDHYVRVHTDVGSELVLMPFFQAIAGLNGLEGLQTHRSWWVARAAVTGIVEDGRKLRLTLSNGGADFPCPRG
ncbi:LytTR family DNA-binding domain-containing protein [Brevundimonas sp.]|uniref:LytTR family DNA-binding domain-containing protein n=1 Tax=Brevundimonas sp. TaxID=1871086 RepID=UPI00289A71FA|nr:LytTR family DNA-binding domain-containing protein [Brevundimonas sp.]